MHEEGFRKAITNVVNRYARKRNLLKEKMTTSSERTSAKASRQSSRFDSRSHSSKDRRRGNSVTCRSARWSNGRQTRGSPTG